MVTSLELNKCRIVKHVVHAFARCAMRSRTGKSALCTFSVRGPACPKKAAESLLGDISADIALIVFFTVFYCKQSLRGQDFIKKLFSLGDQ